MPTAKKHFMNQVDSEINLALSKDLSPSQAELELEYQTVKIMLKASEYDDSTKIQILESLSNYGCYYAKYLLGKTLSPHKEQDNDSTSPITHAESSLKLLKEAESYYSGVMEDSESHWLAFKDKHKTLMADIYFHISKAIQSNLTNKESFVESFNYLDKSISFGRSDACEDIVRLVTKPDSPFDFSYELLIKVLNRASSNNDEWAKGALHKKSIYEQEIRRMYIINRLKRSGISEDTDKDIVVDLAETLSTRREKEIEETSLATALCDLLWQKEPMMADLYITILTSDYDTKESHRKAMDIAQYCRELGGKFNFASLSAANFLINQSEYQKESLKIIKDLAVEGHPDAFLNYGMNLYNSDKFSIAIKYLKRGLNYLNGQKRIDIDSVSRINSIIAECYVRTDVKENKERIIHHLNTAFNQGYITAGVNLAKFHAVNKDLRKSRYILNSVKKQCELVTANNRDNSHPFDNIEAILDWASQFESKIHMRLEMSLKVNKKILDKEGSERARSSPELHLVKGNSTKH